MDLRRAYRRNYNSDQINTKSSMSQKQILFFAGGEGISEEFEYLPGIDLVHGPPRSVLVQQKSMESLSLLGDCILHNFKLFNCIINYYSNYSEYCKAHQG